METLLAIKLQARRNQIIEKILSTQKDPEILRDEITNLTDEELLNLFEECKITFANFRDFK
jgi:hypothetical protein